MHVYICCKYVVTESTAVNKADTKTEELNMLYRISAAFAGIWKAEQLFVFTAVRI